MRHLVAIATLIGSIAAIAGADPVQAGTCPAGFEQIVVGATVQCAHDDETPAPSRSTSFFAAGAEARGLTCVGNGEDGNRLQAVFVTEGAPSLSEADRSAIEVGALSVESVYRESAAALTDDQIVPRWVHDGDCRLDISVVQVEPGTLGDFGDTIEAMIRQGHTRSDRKYIMWADSTQYCGIAALTLDDRKQNNANDGERAGFARIDRGCWGHQGSVVTHEVTHTLGGVLPSAPNATAFGHCTDEYDIMCYADAPSTTTVVRCPDRSGDLLLDCNNDDYFHPDPAPGSWLHTHWNVADSSFLERIAPAPEEPIAEPVSFGDVPGESPYRASIGWLADRGVTRGCGQGRFCPDDTVTRGQMAAFLYRFAEGRGAGASGRFADVGSDSPFATEIEWLVDQGITQGCGQGGFCPDDTVTRGQMAAFLYRMFGPGPGAVVSGPAFDDVGAGFEAEIGWLASVGITNGCGPQRFCPDGAVTRAQMAVFLHRSADLLSPSGSDADLP